MMTNADWWARVVKAHANDWLVFAGWDIMRASPEEQELSTRTDSAVGGFSDPRNGDAATLSNQVT
jgi:hypothetical protein